MEFIFLCVRIYLFCVYALFIWINYSFISALNWYMCTKVLPFLGWIWVWAEVLHFISVKVLFAILHPPTLSWQSLIVILLVLIFLSSAFLCFLLLPSCCFFPPECLSPSDQVLLLLSPKYVTDIFTFLHF